MALAQLDCALGDVPENAQRASAAIAEARRQGADLIMFPELNLTGYALGSVSDDVALRADSPTIMRLAEEAGEMGVVLGFVEDGPVHTYNSAIYLQGGVRIHLQRKTFLPTYGRFEEHKHFSSGQSLRAFDSPLARFAVLICNDVWQPPLPFLAVHDGARVLLVPSSSSLEAGAGTDPAEVQSDWRTLLCFHARFLQSYMVFVNRVGEEAGVNFWGGSMVVDPWGRVIAEAPRHQAAVVLAELDLEAVRRRRREMPLVKEGRLSLLQREFGRLADAER